MGDLDYKIKNYNPDLELSHNRLNFYGKRDYGHSLADAMIKARETLKLKHEVERGSKIIQILEETHPKYLANAPRKNIKLKGILGELNRLGVDVGDYKNMTEIQKWNCYLSIMNKFDLL